MAATQLVAGILLSPEDAESAVSNLTEEGFPGRSISVVARNEADARAIADDAGPLKGTRGSDLSNRLRALGMSTADAKGFTDALEDGRVVLALSVSEPWRDAALETLQSYHAQKVLVV